MLAIFKDGSNEILKTEDQNARKVHVKRYDCTAQSSLWKISLCKKWQNNRHLLRSNAANGSEWWMKSDGNLKLVKTGSHPIYWWMSHIRRKWREQRSTLNPIYGAKNEWFGWSMIVPKVKRHCEHRRSYKNQTKEKIHNTHNFCEWKKR